MAGYQEASRLRLLPRRRQRCRPELRPRRRRLLAVLRGPTCHVFRCFCSVFPRPLSLLMQLLLVLPFVGTFFSVFLLNFPIGPPPVLVVFRAVADAVAGVAFCAAAGFAGGGLSDDADDGDVGTCIPAGIPWGAPL